MRNPLCLDGLRGPRLLHPMHTCSMGDSFVFPAAESAPTVYCTMSTASARKSCSSNSPGKTNRPTTNDPEKNSNNFIVRVPRAEGRPGFPPRSFLQCQVIKHSSNTFSRLRISSVYTENKVALSAWCWELNRLRLLKKTVQQGRSR